jgi:PAS domain S-box-containing protein
MKDQTRTKQSLIQELASLRERLTALEKSEAERKHAEEMLRQSEENFRHYFDDSPTGVRIVTKEGETIYANRAILNIYGYDSIEELKTSPSKKRYTPESHPDFLIRRKKRQQGIDVPSEYAISIVRKDGEVRYLWVLRREILWDGEKQFQVLYNDITERMQAEETLRKRDIQLKKLSSWVPGMIYQFTKRPDGTYCIPFATEAIKDIFGCSSQDVSEDFSPIARIILPDDFDKVIGSIEYSARHLTNWTCEYRIQIPGQSIKWIAGNSTPEKLSDGSITWHGFSTDITERKQMEFQREAALEALRESEEQYRNLFENANEAIVVAQDGKMVFLNPMTAMLFGYPREELASRPFVDFLRPDDRDMVFDRHVRRMKGEDIPKRYSFRLIQKDGNVRWVALSAIFINWKGKPATLNFLTDITEHKQAEEVLQNRESLLQKIFDVLPVGLWFADKDGNLLRGNPAGVKIWGAEPKVVLAEYGIFKARRLPSGEELAPEDWSLVRTVREMVTVVDEMLEIDAFDGKKKIILNYTAPVLDDQGAIQGAIVVNLDITSHKQMEEQLRNSQLQFRALAARLQKIREEERAMMAREIHDEMGGGLTGLKMDLSWLLRKMGTADRGEERTKLIDKIHTANALIDQMIRVVRRISTALRPSVLDDLGLVAALEWQLSEFTSRTEIPHEFTTTCEYVNMEKDTAIAVFRIFQEALTNVVRHSRATKVAVILGESERSLFGDESLVLEIRDNGGGITEEEILNPESLGLLGMKERVLAFGGEISIYGKPGEGTTLILKIPLIQGEAS